MAEEVNLNIDASHHQRGVLNRLNDSRKNSGQCDFAIKAGKGVISAHRNVLAASSEYFRAMLEHDTKENRRGFMEINGDAEVPVKKCIDFIYTGEASTSHENTGQLMHYATMFQLEELILGIVDFLNNSLSPISFFHAKSLADTYNCESLSEKCDVFAFERFGEISVMDDFLKLEEKYVLHLIGSKDTKAAEVTKFRAFMKWINHCYENRKDCFLQMLKVIDVTDVPAIYRRFVVENEPLVFESAECLKIFMVSFFESVDVGAREMVDGIGSRIAVFDQETKSIRSYDPVMSSWQKLQNMDDSLPATFSSVLVDEYIFVLSSNQEVHRLLYLNSTAKWEKMASMNLNHGNLAYNVAVLDGHIYAVGIEGAVSSRVECYNPKDNTWSNCTNKNTTHCNTALVAAHGKLYSIGGWNGKPKTIRRHPGGEEVYASVERLDPVTSAWSDATPIGKARHSASAAYGVEKIFVMGGNDLNQNLSHTEYYDTFNDAWIGITEMKSSRTRFKALVLKDGIFVLGGDGGTCNIEKLDLDKNEWQIVGNMAAVKFVDVAFLAVVL